MVMMKVRMKMVMMMLESKMSGTDEVGMEELGMNEGLDELGIDEGTEEGTEEVGTEVGTGGPIVIK